MFRRIAHHRRGDKSFPHSRGDVPNYEDVMRDETAFSPLTWGCSGTLRGEYVRDFVFPTHVGMFLQHVGGVGDSLRFPHSRGDVPTSAVFRKNGQTFSPLTWGCSDGRSRPPHEEVVFPTHVGMFRWRRRRRSRLRSFPHSRGDVPWLRSVPCTEREFSPLTWGCSDRRAV